MRIGIDAHLVKARPTGVGKAITRTIETMVDAAPNDEFVIYGNREFPGILDGQANCRVVRTRWIAKSRLLRVAHERFVMPRCLRRDGIDVFFAPGYVFPGLLPVRLVLGVFDLNALKFPDLVRPETKVYYKYALPASVGRATLVVPPTQAVARDIEEILKVDAKYIRVVPCGVDGRFREPPGDVDAAKVKYNIDAPYVLFVGNIEPNKNLANLVKAYFAARLNCGLPHKLVLAGKARHKMRHLKRLIRDLGCEDLVLFPGYVDDADLPALYAGADAFVYPSHAEGFGIPPLEAMLCGTPTITSTDPAVVEVTAEGALHFGSTDLVAFRAALEKVLTDQAFAAGLVERGRAIADKYTWAETGRMTMDVLREAAEL
jgi:glycosyltransferase involved in cell wall biosynthesis